MRSIFHRLKPRFRPLATLVASLLLAAGNVPALADSGLRLSGFGSLGYVHDRRNDIAPARDISQRPDDGAATGDSWLVDSRLGLQLEYRISPSVDVVGQLVLRDQHRGSFDNSAELAYVAVRPQDELDLRFGRINYDAFLMSDHRNVGYAYTWVRPPAEFYGWIPVFSLDGVDAAWRLADGDAQWRVKLQAGSSKADIPIGDGYAFRASKLAGVSLARQSAHWRLKAAYSRFTIDREVPFFAPLHAALERVAAASIPGVSAEAADLRRHLAFADSRVSYTTVGAAYDDGSWLAQAELGLTTADADVVPHGRMAYASVARRIGEWTPFVMLSASRPENALRRAVADWGPLNPPLRDRALFVVNATRIEQQTFSFGTRWDLHPQAAVKLQWDSSRIEPSGYGLWWRDLAINDGRSRVNVVSTTLDFVF